MTCLISCIVTFLIQLSFTLFAVDAYATPKPATRQQSHQAQSRQSPPTFINQYWRIQQKHLVLLKAESTSNISSNDGDDRDGSDSSGDHDGDDPTPVASEETNNNDNKKKNPIEIELEELQHALELIEALEIRNESQIDSYIDKQDQWDSLEEEERVLLNSKEYVKERIDILSEELIQLWMGTKSMDG